MADNVWQIPREVHRETRIDSSNVYLAKEYEWWCRVLHFGVRKAGS